ncbi:BnaC09g11220D [Brassica napus]|uniref:BnaC09g11220D protein n=1 Tax=Brassica napus TaxID=3708 RepID=A0A078GK23_BRANA|nr:BnaC09g11220D [Brassica napus]
MFCVFITHLPPLLHSTIEELKIPRVQHSLKA